MLLKHATIVEEVYRVGLVYPREGLVGLAQLTQDGSLQGTCLMVVAIVDEAAVDLVEGAIKAAHDARLKIIDYMESVIPAPRAEFNKYAPRMEVVKIPGDKIGALIGKGGETIRGICEKTGAQIDIEEEGDFGVVSIFATSGDMMAMAKAEVNAVTAEAEPGKIYEGTVTGIKEFGAFVEILPGKDGLCHISELSDRFVKHPSEVVSVNDQVKVRVLAVDVKKKRISLSMKNVK